MWRKSVGFLIPLIADDLGVDSFYSLSFRFESYVWYQDFCDCRIERERERETCNHCDYRHHPKQFHIESYFEICLTKLIKDGKTHKFDKPNFEEAGNITKIPDLIVFRYWGRICCPKWTRIFLIKKSMESLDVMSSCYPMLLTEVWEPNSEFIFEKRIWNFECRFSTSVVVSLFHF